MRSPGKHCLIKAMCEQLLLWAPVDNLNTSLQWKTIAHEFYLHSCTVRQVFCLFTLYSVFLVWKSLGLWWVVVPAISRKSHSRLCFSSAWSLQRLSGNKLPKLTCLAHRIFLEHSLDPESIFTLDNLILQEFVLIALSIQQIWSQSALSLGTYCLLLDWSETSLHAIWHCKS